MNYCSMHAVNNSCCTLIMHAYLLVIMFLCSHACNTNTQHYLATSTDILLLSYKEDYMTAFPNSDEETVVTRYICNLLCQLPVSVLFFYTCRVSWIEISGTKYNRESVVILESNLLPEFGIIIDIICNSDQYYFVCKHLHTECFSPHFHSYEVSIDDNIVICNPSDLVDYNVLSLYRLSSHPNYFVSLKYHLIEYV